MTESKVRIGLSEEYLETSKITNDAGIVHREGVFVGDPLDENAKALVSDSALGVDDFGLAVRPIGTLPVDVESTVGLTDTELRASPIDVTGPLTDTELRASPVDVTGPLTDTELRASPVSVTGPLTDTELRASEVPTVLYDGAGNAVDVSTTNPNPTDRGLVVRPVITEEFWNEVAKGNVPGHSILHKFGTNHSVGISFEAITIDGVYPTPQVSGATTLRVKAGNANDTAGGSGARSIMVDGLDQTGAEASETLVTAGTSAGASGTITFLRVFRAYVLESGTYPNIGVGSHAADIVIEDSAGTTDWITIYSTGMARGQSQCGFYTIPLGYTAYVRGFYFSINTGKVVDLIFMQRRNILETAPPYSAVRTAAEFSGMTEPYAPPVIMPAGPVPALTDIGFVAMTDVQTSVVSADFEMLLVEDGF